MLYIPRYIQYIYFFIITFTFQLWSFYPHPSSVQAVVTGVSHPFSPPFVPSCLLGCNIPTARRLSSNVANSRSRAFRKSMLVQEKVLASRMHSVRLEPTKLILLGTRITYQATGDVRDLGLGLGLGFDISGISTKQNLSKVLPRAYDKYCHCSGRTHIRRHMVIRSEPTAVPLQHVALFKTPS